MRTLSKGDRVQAVRLGYGPDAGKTFEGTVALASPGYVRVDWDDGYVDRGFVHAYRDLKLLPRGGRLDP